MPHELLEAAKALRAWADTMLKQSLPKPKEKQMANTFQPNFSNRNKEYDNNGARHIVVWVETFDADSNPFSGLQVDLSPSEVRAGAHKVLYAAMQYRLQEQMHKAGQAIAPTIPTPNRGQIDFNTSSTSHGALMYTASLRLLNGNHLTAVSYLSESEYNRHQNRAAVVQELEEHLLERARQRQSATVTAFTTVDYQVLAACTMATWMGRYDHAITLRALPPEEIMIYNAAPSHQATFYSSDLYSPQQIIKSVNHLIPVLRKSRPWFFRESTNYKLHESLAMAMVLVQPDDWHNLILEWPHQAIGDKTKVAYTRDERAGESDKQTVTSVGKYIKRHFSRLPDHEIRNIAANFVQDVFKFVNTTADMIFEIQRGATSCMNWREADAEHHPYNVYDPQYGWHMAIRMEGDKPMGRALCMHDAYSDAKFFVRSYRSVSEGYSPADDALEAWLRNQGYEKRGGWEGCKLKYIPKRGTFLAPYLDGCDQHVTIESNDGEQYLAISDEGEYLCNNTDGTPEEQEDRSSCEHCDEYFDDGDGYWVGRNENVHVCSHCFDNYFVSALGRNSQEYYTNSDNAVWVASQDMHFHKDYLADNGIIQLHDGGYEHLDECVYIERHGDWYHNDDSAIQYCERADEYELCDECEQLTDGTWAHGDDVWCCAHSGEFYMLEDKQRERHTASDGKFVYVDYLEEYEQDIIDNAANAANQTEVL